MQIHFIAIGGAIMHQLAIHSKQKGYRVTGSDDEINDPARSNLQQEDLLPAATGWFPEKIHKDLDAVILGMHARADNPELIRAGELGLRVYSFPEYIYEQARLKTRVVIAGSHGKTTTTSMIMHVLKDQGMDFDYLVGAKVEGFDYSVRLSDAPVMLLEGDEYPASVVEKKPKIHYYHPHIAVLTGIAWDHVNVFPSYENYWEQFRLFLDQLTEEASLIYNAEDKEIIRLLEHSRWPFRILPYATPNYNQRGEQVELNTTEGLIKLQIFGAHNLQNMEAARKVCNLLGVPNEAFYKSFSSFKGAARRLEKIEETEQRVIYRDFAHAPSKLKASLQAAREKYPQHHLIACFELHTYSSLNGSFLHQYAHTMNACDAGAVFYSRQALQLKKLPPLEATAVREGFANSSLEVFNDKHALYNWITGQLKETDRPVCLLLMSSGTFEGMEVTFPLATA